MIRLFRIAAWTLAAAIAVVTLDPISDRPKTGHVGPERFLAYMALGISFTLAYPQRRRWVAVGLVVGAVALEMAQTLTPDRHGRLSDAAVKAAGALVGFAVIVLWAKFAERRAAGRA